MSKYDFKNSFYAAEELELRIGLYLAGYRDKDGIEPNLETVMTENIKEGNRLFHRIGGSY